MEESLLRLVSWRDFSLEYPQTVSVVDLLSVSVYVCALSILFVVYLMIVCPALLVEE